MYPAPAGRRSCSGSRRPPPRPTTTMAELGVFWFFPGARLAFLVYTYLVCRAFPPSKYGVGSPEGCGNGNRGDKTFLLCLQQGDAPFMWGTDLRYRSGRR